MSRRTLFWLIFLVSAGLLAVAFYMEYVMGLEPCPLCWLQRFAFMATGLVALLAAWHNPSGWFGRIYGVLVTAFAGIGLALAGRQLWLQSLPADQVPSCGPSVDYMLEVMPLMEVLATAMQGTGDCAEVSWRFMSLSIAGWTAVFFALIALTGLGILLGWVRGPRRKGWI